MGIFPPSIILPFLFIQVYRNLVGLYGVKPIRLREQVKRNKRRFLKDFMLKLTKKEAYNLVSQIVIASSGKRRKIREKKRGGKRGERGIFAIKSPYSRPLRQILRDIL